MLILVSLHEETRQYDPPLSSQVNNHRNPYQNPSSPKDEDHTLLRMRILSLPFT